MSETYSTREILGAIVAASDTLTERKDEVNRLNVFPVPDGDTGTNMSLTIKSVVDNLAKLDASATSAEICKAITNGALMGARGNSGVITSQILRGLCEGASKADAFDVVALDTVFEVAVETAFRAVRKPVEGTILTVLRDTAHAAHKARKKKMGMEEALAFVVDECYASVQRTPEFLPVLKENGVVDAGGYGLAILVDAFVAHLMGSESTVAASLDIAGNTAPKVEIEQINDWEGSEYRYCNEFLVHSETLDPAEALDFLATMGDCELCVGASPKFKVHVHSNHPDQVLKYFLDRGQIFEVFIHNMDLQAAERNEKLIEEKRERKPLGFVAVAAGEGNAKILESLGVDVVVSGGQTMNPSTESILREIEKVPAETVFVLPNNKNIIMAAQQCVGLASKEVVVVPTETIPQGVTAMMNVDPELEPEELLSVMSGSISGVATAQITYAARNSDFDGFAINEGDYLSLLDGKLFGTNQDISVMLEKLAEKASEKGAEFVTLFYGEDVTEEQAGQAEEIFTQHCPGAELSVLPGGQPVYYYIISIE